MKIENPPHKSFSPPLASGISNIPVISGIGIGLQIQEVPLGRIDDSPQTIAAAVSYWTETIGAHIIEYDSVNKKTYHKEWPIEDDANINYKANLLAGFYDKGIAVRTGKLSRGPYRGRYLCCIDFDSLEAFQAWCGDDYTLESLAKWTRVEWHKDPASIHVFFLSKTPMMDLAQSDDNKIIEVYGENPHLVCVYGKHKDGNTIEVYDNEKISIIDNITKLEIENRIKSFITRYGNYEDYVKELEKLETIVSSGSVHIAVRTMLMSVYFRWQGEFANMSDEQRFQYVVDWDKKKALQANRPSYIGANPKKLEDLWEGIKRKYQGQRQEVKDKREEETKTGSSPDFQMPGCISYQINPDRWIAGTPDGKVAEFSRELDVDKKLGKIKVLVKQVKTFIACKPVKVIRHVNPLSFLEAQDRYTMEFKGMEPSAVFPLKHKTLSEIVAILKNGNALTDKGIEIAIQAQIKGFEQAKLLEVNDSMDFVGFFPDNNNKIISSNISIPEKYPDVVDALNFIEELQIWYKDREDLLAHILLWAVIAPFSFILKVIKAPLLYWIHLYGKPNAGKSSSEEIILAFDGNEKNEDFILNMNHIDTVARFGDTIHGTTFPKIIDELDLTERPDIVKNIVTAVDVVRFRKTLDKNRITEYSIGMTPLLLTGNEPPSTKPEYLKRVRTRNFPEREVHFQSSEEAIRYKAWLADNIGRCRTLGLARNKLALESKQCQEIILDTKLTPFEKSRRIWDAIYKSADRELPSFFSKNLEDTQMEESIGDKKGDILTALESWIIDRCRTLDTNCGGVNGPRKILDEYQESADRLAQLINRKLITCVKRDRDKRIVFSRQIVVELERFGAKQLDLHSLADAIPGANYTKSDGCKVVKCSIDNLTNFFSPSPEKLAS